MKGIAVLAALFLLVGCGGEGRMSYMFAVDPSASMLEYDTVASAAVAWNMCGVVTVAVHKGNAAKGEIPVRFTSDYVPKGLAGATFKINDEPTDIRIKPGVLSGGTNIAIHELGHALNATKDSPDLIDDEGHVNRGVMKTGESGLGDFSEYECGNLRKSRGWQ